MSVAGTLSASSGSADASRLVQVEADGDAMRVIAGSAWTIRELATLQSELSSLPNAIKAKGVTAVTFDLSALQRLDTAGAWLIHKTMSVFGNVGVRSTLAGVREDFRALLDEVGRHAQGAEPVGGGHALKLLVSRAAATLGQAVQDVVGLAGFLGLFLSALARTIIRPGRFRLTAFVHHLEHAGFRAAPIIALICFLIGAVIMQQAAVQLSTYGAEAYSVSMLGVLALREVGVLLTAVMVAGRSASAFTAEIGAMKMREEIDAMRILGIDPVDTLVVPRIMALMVALPLLTFIGDIACLVGGGVVAVAFLDQDVAIYLDRLHDTISPRHFLAGLVKAPMAALLIGLVGCSEGLKVAGNAESLGRHVTRSVVKAIFLVIVLSAALSIFLVSIGV